MKIKHLIIEVETENKILSQVTYLVKNTSNNKFVRLGENEVYCLLETLGEVNSIVELGLNDIRDIPKHLEKKIIEKFGVWGFLDENQKTSESNGFEKFKKIRLVKFNVEKVISKVSPVYSLLFSKVFWGLLMTMMLSIAGYFLYAVVTFQNSSSMATPNLHVSGFTVLMIVAILFLNIVLHEFAHAVSCVKYGGEVKTIGIMLFYLLPCFYCDVSSIYGIKSKKQRAFVALSGIYINLLVANFMLIMAIVLSYFGEVEIVLYYTSMSIIFISMYNLIPFVKLDGYWVLSAITGIDNLMDKSVLLAYTTVFSRKRLKNIQMKPRKRRLLSIYGMISLIFHDLFWFVTFLNIRNVFNLNGVYETILITITVLIIGLDLLKTIQHYYKIIKHDYDRVLMTL